MMYACCISVVKLERTLEHVHAGFGAVPHGVHEDEWQELREDNANLGPHKTIRDHLRQQRGCFLPDCGALGVAEQVQQVDQSTWAREREGGRQE